MNEINTNSEQYISLAEASRMTSYNQDYLGSLCREGKLRGVKIGRNWVTTKEAVNNLLTTLGTSAPVSIPVRVITESFVPSNEPKNNNIESHVETLPIALRTTSSGKPLNHISNVKQKTRDSFELPLINKKNTNKVPSAALIFASFVIMFGLATLHGKNLLLDFFGNHKLNNFTHTIIFNSKNLSTNKIDGQVASETTRDLNSGLVLGTTINSKTKIQSISESDLNKLILSNLENLGSSGWFNKYIDNALPSQVQPPYQQTQLPLNPPAPISYFQSPSQPFNGGSILGVTELSSKEFITDTAIINRTLSVTGDTTLASDLDVTGTITAGSITGTINTGFTAGSVIFQGASGLAQDNSHLYWNDTNNILGVGTASPSAKITIAGASSSGTGTIPSSSGVNVTGSGTLFLTELKVGDEITVNGQSRIVATISSNTALTTTVAFNPAISSTAYVGYVNSATTNTGSSEAHSLSWDHTVDGTISNRMIVVYIAVHKNTALTLPTITSVTYAGQTMTELNTTTNTGSLIRVAAYYLTNPAPGTGSVNVTLSSSDSARIVGQSIVFQNVHQTIPFTSSSGGGGCCSPAAVIASPSVSGDMLTGIVALAGNYTATASNSIGVFTETLNSATGSTSDDVKGLVGYSNDSSILGFYVLNWTLSGSTPHANVSGVMRPITTSIGTYTYRSSLASYADSGSTEQIKIAAGGQATFHRGLTVDLNGGAADSVATFTGGNVGIGTTSPTNKLSVTGNANFSGSLGVAGGAVDPTVGINILSSGAYGGGSVTQYGVAVDLTATDNTSVFGGQFHASSSTSGGLPDHPILEAMQALSYFDGSGRIDAALGSEGSVQNGGSGLINEAYGNFAQLGNFSTGQINHGYGVYSDIINLSSTQAYQDATLFYGKIRTLGGGTSGYGTAYGLRLDSWSTPGATVTNSYGIYMDTSIDIGTTRYALYSSSTSQSYLQGAVGIGDATPDASLEVVNDGSGDSFLVADTNDGDTTPFVIQSDGDVGIGTASPTQALDVAGVFTVHSNDGSIWGGAPSNSFAINALSGSNKNITINPDTTGATYLSYVGGTDGIYFGNGASGTTGKILANGSMGIGDLVSIASGNLPAGSLVIGNGTLCVDNGGDNCDDASRTAGTIYSVGADVTGIDVAENYPSKDSSLEPGEVVMIDVDNAEYIARSNKPYSNLQLGVVSTKPGLRLGGFGDQERFGLDTKYPVALSGRVPVRVTNENGNIKPGDYLTTSKTFSGYAMKATEPGMVIGKALEAFDGEGVSNSGGQILIFINMHSYTPKVADVLQSSNSLYSELEALDLLNATLIDKLVVTHTLRVATLLVHGKAVIQELEVGSSSKPSGITLYDDNNGQPYCVKIKGGQWVQAEGTCETATDFQLNSMPISPRDPAPIDPVIDPPIDPVIDSAPPEVLPEPTVDNSDQSPTL